MIILLKILAVYLAVGAFVVGAAYNDELAHMDAPDVLLPWFLWPFWAIMIAGVWVGNTVKKIAR